MSKKVYHVEAPLVGKVVATVKADDEKEALQAVIELPFSLTGITWENKETVEDFYFEELELMKQVDQGNIVYAPIGEADVELLEEEE